MPLDIGTLLGTIVTTIEVSDYVRDDGSNPFKRWFDDVEPVAAAKVATSQFRTGGAPVAGARRSKGGGSCR
jgi:hypothetical protein